MRSTLLRTSELTPRSGFFHRRFLSAGGQNNRYVLHSEIISTPNDGNDSIVFLHGLLGNGRNLKTFAKRLCEQKSQNGILLDLRGHGKSVSGPVLTRNEHTFDACVRDVAHSLSQTTGKPELNLEMPKTVVGHSWGGRIGLQLTAAAAGDGSLMNSAPIDQLWLLDTIPGQANESVEQVINSIESLYASFQEQRSDQPLSRVDIIQLLSKQYKLEPALAQWLASTYNVKSRKFEGFDLEVVHGLMPQFATQDFYGLLSSILEGGKTHVHLVRGGANKAWNTDTLQKLERIQKQNSGLFFLHTLPKAGHWVHVEDLRGLLKLI